MWWETQDVSTESLEETVNRNSSLVIGNCSFYLSSAFDEQPKFIEKRIYCISDETDYSDFITRTVVTSK